jgi:spore maturation protein CgeB
MQQIWGSPVEEKRVALLVGPSFFGYNQSMSRALLDNGYETGVIDTPAHNPTGLVNRLRIDVGQALGVQRYKDQWRKTFNADLLKRARATNPDLFMLIRGEWIDPETFSSIPAKTKLLWFQDSAHRCCAHHVELAKRATAVFVFERLDIPYLVEKGVDPEKIRFLPMGYDPATYRDLQSSKEIDVSFVGRMYDERKQIIHRLVAELPDTTFEVWGRYVRYKEPRTWALWMRRQMSKRLRQTYRNKNIPPQVTNEVYNRSKIALNIHHSQSQQGCNPRVFEIMGSGTFQICDRNDHVRENVSRDVVQFEDYDDLKQKIVTFLADDAQREKIERKCRAVVGAHTFKARMQEALSSINCRTP